MRTWGVQFGIPILAGLAVLLGVLGLGRCTRAALNERDGFAFSYDAIDLQPPEKLTRADFLEEVRRRARDPERLHLLDANLPARLARAFAADPWVESVRSIRVSRTGPKVHVDLEYRHPVLAVRLPRHDARTPPRVVDRNGVLLPSNAVPSGLPILIADVSAPTNRPGERWHDRRVVAAAATVGFLKPHLSRLGLEGCDVEIVQGEVVFRKPGVRIVWGHAPGREEASEASAPVKLRRLLDYQAGHNGLESLEHDVRLLAYQGHFPLASEFFP